MLIAGCGPAATPSPVIVTVVQTALVEVTRLAEITQPIEVTRQVVMTQLVEVTVTPPLSGTPVQVGTPMQGIPMTQTPTPANVAGQSAPSSVVTPYNWITPDQKGQGFTPVFLQNETSNTMKVALAGPVSMEVTVAPGRSQKVWLRRGDYSFETWKDDRKSYSGNFSITSADKYQLIFRDSKAVLWVP
jgi:hypothetical protein